MKKIFLLIAVISSLMVSNSFSQEKDVEQDVAKIKPFSWTMFGVTVTGQYSDGCLTSTVVNGTSLFWGAFTWGGSTQTSCEPGCSFCHVTAVFSINRMGVTVNDKGEKCFEKFNLPEGTTPTIIGEKDGKLTFAIDINQTADHHKTLYGRSVFVVEKPFAINPDLVRKLNLNNSEVDMGYLIPAGKYPLYRDGNIYYWTFEPPVQMH